MRSHPSPASRPRSAEAPAHRAAAAAALLLALLLTVAGASLLLSLWWQSGHEGGDVPAVLATVLAPAACLLALIGHWRGPFRLSVAGTSRLLLVAFVATWVAHLAAGQPHGAVSLTLTLVLGSGGFAGLHELVRRTRVTQRRGWRMVELVLVQLCLTVLLAELGLRLLARRRPSELLARPSDPVAARIERNRLRPGSLRFGFPVSSRGYYDEEPAPARPGHRLVVSIGDSFSAGVVPHPFHFTTVAERALTAVEVVNLGLPALGPAEYLYLLETEALPLRPDLVVINLFLGNDLPVSAAVAGAAPVQAGPLLRLAGSLAPALDSWLSADRVLWPKALTRLAAVARGLVGGGESTGPERLDPARLADRYPWLEDPHRERPTFRREPFLRMTLATARRLAVHEPAVIEPLIAQLESMREAVGETPIIFSLIPAEHEVEDALWDEIRARAGEPLPRDPVRRALLAALERHDLPVLDLLPALRAQPVDDDGHRHLYHLQDTHFNARGNRVAGEALAAAIAAQLGGASPTTSR